ATVRQVNEYVIVEAVTVPSYPTETPECFSWSGGIAVPGQPFKRKVLKTWPRKAHISATCGSNSDYVDVWIVWASLEVQIDANETIDHGNGATMLVDHNWPTEDPPAALGGGKKLGPMDYDGTPSMTYRYAIGKMQAKASLIPAGIEDVVEQGWHMKRILNGKVWHNGGAYDLVTGEFYPTGTYILTNEDDTSPASAVDLDPNSGSSTRELYDLDAPGCPALWLSGTTIYYTSESYGNFDQYVTVDLPSDNNCSNTVEWSYTAWVDMDKAAGSRVEKNELSLSSITIPSSAH
ncbi:MAG: hypothetical protein ACYS29_18700, partial [Planctomycetota bacterium]